MEGHGDTGSIERVCQGAARKEKNFFKKNSLSSGRRITTHATFVRRFVPVLALLDGVRQRGRVVDQVRDVKRAWGRGVDPMV